MKVTLNRYKNGLIDDTKTLELLGILKDNSKKCGINPSECNGGVQCLRDNGRDKYCKKCACRTCTKGKC